MVSSVPPVARQALGKSSRALHILNLMGGTQGRRKAKTGGKEKLRDCFKGKATILKLCLKLLLIMFETSRRDLSLT